MSDREESTAETDDDGGWRFSLEDIDERERQAEAAAEAEKRRRQPLEAGDPSLEATAFFLLGVCFALFVVWRLVAG